MKKRDEQGEEEEDEKEKKTKRGRRRRRRRLRGRRGRTLAGRDVTAFQIFNFAPKAEFVPVDLI